MDFLTRAYELQEETIANRRHIHQHAETGLDLPETVAFVKDMQDFLQVNKFSTFTCA